ncbi:MAG: PepSY-like domain-containing protein [Cytophagaceae bacterium]|nr:PepSY-like domain-containing protein [Cytophagaceae bacterium]
MKIAPWATVVALTLTFASCDRTRPDVDPQAGDPLVPAAVVNAIKTAFPAATEVKFYPVEKNVVWGSNFNLQRQPHEVVISQSGQILEALKIGQTNELPATILAYLAQNYPGYKVDVFAQSTGTPTQYKVLITNGQKTQTLLFDASGKLTLAVETGAVSTATTAKTYSVKFDDLPAAIKKALAGYVFQSALAVSSSAGSYYEVAATKDNLIHHFYFDAQGVLLKSYTTPDTKSTSSILLKNQLPAVILTYLDTTYPGYEFVEATASKTNGTVTAYYVLIKHSGAKYYVYFDGSGKFGAVKKQ